MVASETNEERRNGQLIPVRSCDQLAQALVVLGAGRAALQMLAHTGQARVGVLTRELQLDVLVEQLEAVLAGHLVSGRPQKPGDQVATLVVCAHDRSPL